MARVAVSRKLMPLRHGPQLEARAKKVSITVDARVLQEVARVAERSGRTLSAQITDALARDLRRRALEELIEDYEHKYGAITDAEMAKVRRRWQD